MAAAAEAEAASSPPSLTLDALAHVLSLYDSRQWNACSDALELLLTCSSEINTSPFVQSLLSGFQCDFGYGNATTAPTRANGSRASSSSSSSSKRAKNEKNIAGRIVASLYRSDEFRNDVKHAIVNAPMEYARVVHAISCDARALAAIVEDAGDVVLALGRDLKAHVDAVSANETNDTSRRTAHPDAVVDVLVAAHTIASKAGASPSQAAAATTTSISTQRTLI